MMNQIKMLAFAGLAVLAASMAHGQERPTTPAGTGDVYGTISGPEDFRPGEPRTPLATVGGFNVDVWAPMEQHYTGRATDPAGQTFWDRR